MKIKLSKSQWEIMGKEAGWIKQAQTNPPQQNQPQQQPKQMQIFNQNYQSLMRTLNSLTPDVQNKASAAFSNAFNSVKSMLDNPNSWMQ